jgi:putative transposase
MEIYKIANVSKQTMYKYRLRVNYMNTQEDKVIEAMNKVRLNHKKMSSRKVYTIEKQNANIEIGRDRFEKLAFKNGFQVRQKRSYHKTTWSQKVEVYPDLVSGLQINNINKVYQSDIFYLDVDSIPYYGVTIMDIYSKLLLALHLSKSLRAIENINAMKEVLKMKKETDLKGCIFHSDRGTQYICKNQKKLLTELDMKISMSKMPQQNAYVERIQGTLKYEYFFETILTEKNITRASNKIKHLYNNERPHLSLDYKTPIQFESWIKTLSDKERPVLKIFDWK